MDLNCNTIVVNRSNYCSILKKRKSSYKENVTVKLKRHLAKDEGDDDTHRMNEEEEVSEHNHEKLTDSSMCLICRTRNKCSTDKSYTSMVSTFRRNQQQENDIRQSCTNCVVKTRSATTTTTTTTTSKRYALLDIANPKRSESQWWNATAVNFRWCRNSMPPPLFQLQSTSASLIPPTESKTEATSSSSIETDTAAPLSTRVCSSSFLLSSSTTTANEISSSALPLSSPSTTTASSSRTNASPSCRSGGSCWQSITTKSGTSFSGIGKKCNKNVSGVLRTLRLIAVILEKCLIGMFGTRKQISQEHKNDNRVMPRCRIVKHGFNSCLFTRFPIVLMCLVFSLMTMMLSASVAAEVRLQSNETVCRSKDLRNDPADFANLTNCTVIEGFLLISLMEPGNSTYDNLSFPMLTEVTEFIMIYRVTGLRTLNQLFPNLSVIRGKELFEGFALVIYENTHLEDLGLTSLTTIARGAVRIEKNPALCFVETIDWTHIAVNITSDQHFFRENKAEKECPVCPGEADKQSDNTELSVSCPLVQGQRHCWNSTFCQKICPPSCKNNCNDELKCCDEACIGGCAKNNLSSCTSCRHFTKMDVCVDKCPENWFRFLDRRCVTAQTCLSDIGSKLEGTKKESVVPFDGVCSVRCPAGHTKIKTTCVKCEGKCVKKCKGGLIDSVGAAKTMHGCTRITEEPLSISIKRGGRHLMEELELGLSSIEEIDTYLKVHRTYGMVSLAFFKNLKRIRGEKLESNKFALYVLENQDLESIWGPNQTVKMDKGRVFFHFNPKLCFSDIDKLRPSLQNASQFDKNEVATDSNGSKGSCNTEVLNIKVGKISSGHAFVNITNPMIFEDDRTFIGYQFFYTEDPYKNVSMFGHRPCDDSWSSQDPSKDTDHLLTNLKPFTQYAVYVKTQTISSEPRNGQSPIIYFRTKPDQPKSVQNLKSVSNSSSEIIVAWLRPTVTNGNLTKYIITATLDINDPAKLKSRNYCSDPLKEAATGDSSFPTIIEKIDPGLISNGGADCKCEKNVTRTDGSNPQMEEAIYENIIDFENNIQNFVYVKQNKNTTKLSLRRRRAVDLYNSIEKQTTPPEKITTTPPPTAQTLVPKSDKVSRMDTEGKYYEYVIDSVNATVTEFVLKNLKHFSLYTIGVRACRAPEEGASSTECSPQSIAYARTQKLVDVDIIRNLQVKQEPSNTTRGNLRVKWDPPERPNSLVVSYTIFYITANSQDAVHEKRCITALDYQQNFTNGYLLTGLPTGNYSIRVRANSLAGEGIKSEPVYEYIAPNRISWQTITFICIGIILFIIIVACVFQYVRKKLFAPPSDLKIFPAVNPYYISMQYLPDEWEVPRDKIIQLGALGQGSFGMVYVGILKNFNNQEDTPCAIKTVNENATDRERLNFLKEASVMKQFNTHHVVRLLGVCSRGQPALVIMELMKNGDLKAYLRQHRPDAEPSADGEPPTQPPTLGRILQMAIEIADGMAYLAAKKYVHRDLAARNCMVAADLTVKIGDFGMTRDVYETDYYRKGTKGLLPVRWMSPESLKDGVFSSASDVFSYGVVLWEMATFASQPYQGFSNDQVLRFVIDGGVMERPENCPDKLYKLMQKCWQHRPSARPSFIEIISFLLDTADPKFEQVSFYHSAEARDMLEQKHPEHHDMDDVTTPLRVGEFDYKLNIDDNSSVEPHESPVLDEEEEDDDDENVQPHSPYSLGSVILISSTPGGHSKHSPNIVMNKSNPSLSLPSTSAAAKAAASGAVSVNENAEYVEPDPSYEYNEQQHLNEQHRPPSSSNNNDGPTQKAIKNYASSPSAASSKYPNSFKRAVASTVQNVSNSLVPLRLPNMNFLHRRLFKNKSNQSSSESRRGHHRNSGTKSETSSNNGNNNNANVNAMGANIEMGGSRSFFAGLTPSHTSKNPNYQILDESLNVSAMQDEQYPLEKRLFPTRSRQEGLCSRTGSFSSGGSGNSNRNNYNSTIQQKQQPHHTAEQCNLNRDSSNLSTSSNFKDTKSSQKQNQPINLLSAHELSSSSGVSSPISIKDNRNTSDASKVISTSTTPATAITTATPYQLKENWLRQMPQLPPNGFIGREG